jgi:hypothetical protein
MSMEFFAWPWMRDFFGPDVDKYKFTHLSGALLFVPYGVTVDDANTAVIDMTLTSAACPLTDVIEDQTRQVLDGLASDVRINWVWMPPWGPDKITESGREQLRALGFTV